MNKLPAFAFAIVGYLLLVLALGGCVAAFPTEPARENPKHNYYYRHPYPIQHRVIRDRDPSVAPESAKVLRYERPAKRLGLFRRKQQVLEVQVADSTQPVASQAGLLRKCKNCQITVVSGDNNKVSQARVGKVRAPAAIAADSATVVDQRGVSQAAANTGKGSSSAQIQAKPKPTVAELLLKPVGIALAIVLLFLVLVAWLKRRSRNA